MSESTDTLKAKLDAFAREIQPTLEAAKITRVTLVIDRQRFTTSIQTEPTAKTTPTPPPA